MSKNNRSRIYSNANFTNPLDETHKRRTVSHEYLVVVHSEIKTSDLFETGDKQHSGSPAAVASLAAEAWDLLKQGQREATHVAQEHPLLSKLAIDGITAAVGAAAVVGLAPGAAAVGMGFAAGAAANELLHLATGERLTAKNVVRNLFSSAIATTFGGAAGLLERQMANKFADNYLMGALEIAADRTGLPGAGSFAKNLFIKGAAHLHLDQDALDLMRPMQRTVVRSLGYATDLSRRSFYNKVLSYPLRPVAMGEFDYLTSAKTVVKNAATAGGAELVHYK